MLRCYGEIERGIEIPGRGKRVGSIPDLLNWILRAGLGNLHTGGSNRMDFGRPIDLEPPKRPIRPIRRDHRFEKVDIPPTGWQPDRP